MRSESFAASDTFRRSSVKTMRGILHSSPGFGEGLVVARMTRIRFGPLVVAVLLSLSARAAASETAPAQTRIDLVGVPRGLADIGSAACDDAPRTLERMYDLVSALPGGGGAG